MQVIFGKLRNHFSRLSQYNATAPSQHHSPCSLFSTRSCQFLVTLDAIMGPPNKKRKLAVTAPETIEFNFAAREEYLTGFHKRKLERKKHAQEENAKREKEEKLRLRREVCVRLFWWFGKAQEQHYLQRSASSAYTM